MICSCISLKKPLKIHHNEHLHDDDDEQKENESFRWRWTHSLTPFDHHLMTFFDLFLFSP